MQKRRSFLSGVAAIGIATLAGCTDSGGNPETEDDDQPTTEAPDRTETRDVTEEPQPGDPGEPDVIGEPVEAGTLTDGEGVTHEIRVNAENTIRVEVVHESGYNTVVQLEDAAGDVEKFEQIEDEGAISDHVRQGQKEYTVIITPTERASYEIYIEVPPSER